MLLFCYIILSYLTCVSYVIILVYYFILLNLSYRILSYLAVILSHSILSYHILSFYVILFY